MNDEIVKNLSNGGKKWRLFLIINGQRTFSGIFVPKSRKIKIARGEGGGGRKEKSRYLEIAVNKQGIKLNSLNKLVLYLSDVIVRDTMSK